MILSFVILNQHEFLQIVSSEDDLRVAFDIVVSENAVLGGELCL